jgi:hypothetical protein
LILKRLVQTFEPGGCKSRQDRRDLRPKFFWIISREANYLLLPVAAFLPVAALAPVVAFLLVEALAPVDVLAFAPVEALAPVDAEPCALTPRVIVAAIKSIAIVLMVFMFFCFLIVN